MHRFKRTILAKLKNCQNGTFEPVHEIQKFFLAKSILLKHNENGSNVASRQDGGETSAERRRTVGGTAE